ncbi:hypothetical protein [Scytonema sp. NUACC26]|uniref:hypothetical protein n=1 Tax=Scytonema sp. NUACC26 TaxID=3140176 RepID=UPI0034DBF249
MNHPELIAILLEEKVRYQNEVDWRLLQIERINQLLLGYEQEDRKREEEHHTPLQQKAHITEIKEAAIQPINYSPPKVKPASTTVQVLPEYRGKTIISLVESIMLEAPEQAFHADFITKKLYGDLPKEQHKVASDRIRSQLQQGQKQQRWYKVRRNPGCYSIKQLP